jgi:oxygen-independent coproporphyrinogen-3 oxidase
MYEYAEEFLKQNGYTHYEISNWALDNEESVTDRPPSFSCRHNLQYWRSLPYLAFGAGAHGYAGGYRYSNALRIKTYIERLESGQNSKIEFPLSPAAVNQHKQTRQDDISEYMLNNLRLVMAGVAESDFRSRFGCGIADIYPGEMEKLIRDGLVEKKTSENSEVFRLTKRGRLLGNQVFLQFLP